MVHPSKLNGDNPLSPDERRAYLAYHARRNAERRRAGRDVPTLPGPHRPVTRTPGASPSRVAVSMFFRLAAEEARRRFAGRPVTILDLGCGRGNVLDAFLDVGMTGHYVGLDLVRHARWSDEPIGAFTRELILGDIHALDFSRLPMADIVTSCTALEHIRDDAWAVGMLATRTAQCGLHAHAMPGEGALALYGTHGWRQYTPVDLDALFPGGTIYRYGGPFSHRWHRTAITRRLMKGKSMLHESRPRLYARVRDAAMRADHILGEHLPTIYGVLWSPPAAAIRHAA